MFKACYSVFWTTRSAIFKYIWLYKCKENVRSSTCVRGEFSNLTYLIIITRSLSWKPVARKCSGNIKLAKERKLFWVIQVASYKEQEDLETATFVNSPIKLVKAFLCTERQPQHSCFLESFWPDISQNITWRLVFKTIFEWLISDKQSWTIPLLR